MYGYYYGYNDSSYWLFMILSVIVSMYAHFKVQHAFSKYSKVSCKQGLTGAEAARRVLEYNNVEGISVERTRGYFTDYFDSRSRKICLSEQVYSASTVAAVSVAAHESGHAVQNDQEYFPLKLRHMLVPISQIGSNLAMPLVILGLMIPRWGFAINLGILFFSLAVIFQIVTLPVEFNASRRALKSIEETGILCDEEKEAAKKVLTAAALTYVAATFAALVSLLRLILISKNRKN